MLYTVEQLNQQLTQFTNTNKLYVYWVSDDNVREWVKEKINDNETLTNDEAHELIGSVTSYLSEKKIEDVLKSVSGIFDDDDSLWDNLDDLFIEVTNNVIADYKDEKENWEQEKEQDNGTNP